ncbi:MAG: dTMP kinase [Pedosphaera sp.]|nr:dTMP kinase [Pedosphaera sp.]MSS99898.1 dTMP kinase [Pedosphaera sp.]
MSGLFITFEGTEGAGKSTHIRLLSERLRKLGRTVRELREPGGTPLGEEIRHLLKHHPAGRGMTPEAELLLMNASRAQLVREVIRPALDAGEVVLCDRFFDSTVAYQGHGRGLDLKLVEPIIAAAVGEMIPHLTLFLHVPLAVSESRRLSRQNEQGAPADRFEESERTFFERVERGFKTIAAAEPKRVRIVDASGKIEAIADAIWVHVEPLLKNRDERN